MRQTHDILCIGSVLWDVIGRARAHMTHGSDVPGRITRLPGGVALNIAMTLVRFGMRPAILSTIGRDAEGEELIRGCRAMGIEVEYLHRSDDLPTDRYLAIEGANGLIAAIADAHSLEQVGAKILAPLLDGRIGSEADPYEGLVALDGNLTQALLQEIARHPAFARADLRVAPASPGKAERLLPFLDHERAVIYVNREEAELLCQRPFDDAAEAAQGLLSRGAARVLVTDGGRAACEGTRRGLCQMQPPEVMVTRVTGAGDTFMAAHIAAEAGGQHGPVALERALQAAAAYVAGGAAN